MNLLRKPVPAKLLTTCLFVVLGLVVIGFFFPSEEVVLWHLTSSDTNWSCQRFSVIAARSWIAEAGSNCSMGIHLVRPRPTILGSLKLRGSVTFLDQKLIGDDSFNMRLERTFRILSGTPSDAALHYTNNYHDSLGRCAIASNANQDSTVLLCQDAKTQLVTWYSGDKTFLPDILAMVHQH